MSDSESEREVARILALTDEEVVREAAERGDDIELVVATTTAMIDLAIEKTNQ